MYWLGRLARVDNNSVEARKKRIWLQEVIIECRNSGMSREAVKCSRFVCKSVHSSGLETLEKVSSSSRGGSCLESFESCYFSVRSIHLFLRIDFGKNDISVFQYVVDEGLYRGIFLPR
jgi:hypothetical protein